MVPMKRVFRGLAWGGGGVLFLAAVLWITFPRWSGFGPWIPLPDTPPPLTSHLLDQRFRVAAHGAMAALEEHRLTHGFPGITAAVAVGGEVVWAGGVGWADLEEARAATPATLFRIGSTSKVVTATALARLVDRGVLALDDSLGAVSRAWPNPRWGRLTLRQLASHTAGLPGYEENRDLAGAFVTLWGRRSYSSVRESLEVFDGSRLLYEPGTEFHYSSFDVNLLGAALAKSQDEPFLDLLDRLVFRPLGVSGVGGDGDGVIRPDLATFYEIDGLRARVWRPFDLSQRWPSGGLVARSADLVRIGGAWTDTTFIRAETREAMWTPQPLADGRVNEQSYAVGWRFYPQAAWPGDSTRILAFAHHGGVSKGAMSWLVVYPDYQLSIAVNTNTRAETFQGFAAVEDRIAALFLSRLNDLRDGGESDGGGIQ